MTKINCASFFAGVGGIDQGFIQNAFNIVYANDSDKKASLTFNANFDIKTDNRKIEDVKCSEIPDFDVMLAGFPCQSFSIAGYRKGFKDERTGHLFFELERIFKNKKPSVIFLENVKNLVSHDKGITFKVILDSLEENGYYVKYKVLNAKEYGNIPQNRERIYVVAFKDKESYYKFDFPKPILLTKTLKDVIDYRGKVDDKYYYTPEKNIMYNKIAEGMKNKDSIYQWRRVYVRENKSKVSPTLTANMGTGGHNVPLILAKHGIRKLTPHECFNLQGFPNDYILPDIADSHLYKQAGNSVVVSVISRIAKEIKSVM